MSLLSFYLKICDSFLSAFLSPDWRSSDDPLYFFASPGSFCNCPSRQRSGRCRWPLLPHMGKFFLLLRPSHGQIPALKPKSSLITQILAWRLKSQSLGSNPCLETQMPPLKPKNKPPQPIFCLEAQKLAQWPIQQAQFPKDFPKRPSIGHKPLWGHCPYHHLMGMGYRWPLTLLRLFTTGPTAWLG